MLGLITWNCGTFAQDVELSYRRGSEVGRPQKPIVPRIEGHKLSEVANMLNWIGFTIIIDERQASKVPRHFGTFYVLEKWWPSNSPERLAHGIQGSAKVFASFSLWWRWTVAFRFVRSIPRHLIMSLVWQSLNVPTCGVLPMGGLLGVSSLASTPHLNL